MSLSPSHFIGNFLEELQTKPVPGKFSVESLEDTGKVISICDPRVKNAAFAEIVQWVWEKYYAHLEATPGRESMAVETV